jgi:hypothetical protein
MAPEFLRAPWFRFASQEEFVVHPKILVERVGQLYLRALEVVRGFVTVAGRGRRHSIEFLFGLVACGSRAGCTSASGTTRQCERRLAHQFGSRQ